MDRMSQLAKVARAMHQSLWVVHQSPCMWWWKIQNNLKSSWIHAYLSRYAWMKRIQRAWNRAWSYVCVAAALSKVCTRICVRDIDNASCACIVLSLISVSFICAGSKEISSNFEESLELCMLSRRNLVTDAFRLHLHSHGHHWAIKVCIDMFQGFLWFSITKTFTYIDVEMSRKHVWGTKCCLHI